MDLLDFIRDCDWGFVALLLQGASDGECNGSGGGRQVEYRLHVDIGLFLLARYVHGEVLDWLCTDCDRDNCNGVVIENSVRNFPYAIFDVD